jgi:maltose alpha-D-glucosyltransferase/alpha-amylase
MKHFVATRKAHPVLGWGSCRFLRLDNKAILAYLRQSDQAHLLIVCNLSGEVQQATLPLADFVGHRPVDVLSRQTLPIISQTDYGLSLQPYQYHWLSFG